MKILIALCSLILLVAPPLNAQTAPVRETGESWLTGTRGDVLVDGDGTFTTSGVVLRSKAGWPSLAAQTGSADTTSGFVVFNSANTALLYVRSDGKTGIGTSSPNALLHLARAATGIGPELLLEHKSGTIADASAITFSSTGATRAQIYSGIDPNSARGFLELRTGLYTADTRMTISGYGDVTIAGRATPLRIKSDQPGPAVEFHDLFYASGLPNGTRLLMQGNSEIVVSGLRIGNRSEPVISNTAGGDVLVQSRLNAQNLEGNSDMWVTSGNDPGVHHSPMLSLRRLDGNNAPITTFAFWIDPADNKLKLMQAAAAEIPRDQTQPAPIFTIDPAGNVTVKGAITAATVIGSVYQDLAEWVPATRDMPPGTVVILNPDRANEVMPSHGEYDARVAGVISEQPGLLLGQGGDGKEMVATTGRVKVHVEATNAPIRIGDLLVSSNRPGVAMKSQPIDVAGIAIHRPGTIIGKALEPLQSGQGEILVLLSLQ